MEIPHHVVWSEGMLMTPQHLQQQDAWLQWIIERRITSLRGDAYGVQHLQLDHGALQAGVVAVNAFHGIMPSGLPVQWERSDPHAPCPVTLHDDDLRAQPASVPVYVTLPTARLGVNNVMEAPPTHGSGQPLSSRFISARHPMVDFNQPVPHADPVHVVVAHPNLQITMHDHGEHHHERLKIAEIQHVAPGHMIYDPTFIPPCVYARAAPHLMAQLDGLWRDIQRCIHQMQHSATDASLLAALRRAAPVIKAHADDGSTPPSQLYFSLLPLWGELTGKAMPPPWQYHDLRSTFATLFDDLRQHLTPAAHTIPLEVPWIQAPDGVWHASLTDPRWREVTQITITFTCHTTMSDVARAAVGAAFSRHARLAARRDLPTLLTTAMPGIPLVSMTPESSMATPSSTTWIAMTVTTPHPHWERILQDGEAALYLPAHVFTGAEGCTGILRGTGQGAPRSAPWR